MDTIQIFDVSIANLRSANAISLIDEAVKAGTNTRVFFVNADCLNISVRDDEYRSILNEAEYVFGDGSGIWIASRLAGTPIVDNVNGTDMLPLLCALCSERAYSIYLLGAESGIAETMKQRLEAQYDGLSICGCRDGYFDWEKDDDEVIETINASGADILLVAFGAPLQEKWIHFRRNAINWPVKIGVGGLFNFYSDAKPRAPMWMRKAGIEWAHRLYYDPRRLWRRYMLGNPLFLMRVLRRIWRSPA